jgi:hypothetical protein
MANHSVQPQLIKCPMYRFGGFSFFVVLESDSLSVTSRHGTNETRRNSTQTTIQFFVPECGLRVRVLAIPTALDNYSWISLSSPKRDTVGRLVGPLVGLGLSWLISGSIAAVYFLISYEPCC